MTIHPRESDLVIATFGRALWVLDDIRPLRALASSGRKLLNTEITVFDAPEAYLSSTRNLPGYYFYGDAMYRGQNREPGAMISFYSSSDSGKISMEIKDEAGTVVKTQEIKAVKGFNRFTWRLDRNPLPQLTYPSGQDQQQDPRARFFRGFGGTVLPGTYTVSLSLGNAKSMSKITVSADPRMAAPDIDALRKNYERAVTFGAGIESLNAKLRNLVTVRESLAKTDKLIAEHPDFAATVSGEYKAVKEELAKMDEAFGRRQDGLTGRIGGYRSLLMASGPLTEQEEQVIADAGNALEEAARMAGSFLDGSWARYKAKLKEITLTGEEVILK